MEPEYDQRSGPDEARNDLRERSSHPVAPPGEVRHPERKRGTSYQVMDHTNSLRDRRRSGGPSPSARFGMTDAELQVER